jgi:hypothetical protein
LNICSALCATNTVFSTNAIADRGTAIPKAGRIAYHTAKLT